MTTMTTILMLLTLLLLPKAGFMVDAIVATQPDVPISCNAIQDTCDHYAVQNAGATPERGGASTFAAAVCPAGTVVAKVVYFHYWYSILASPVATQLHCYNLVFPTPFGTGGTPSVGSLNSTIQVGNFVGVLNSANPITLTCPAGSVVVAYAGDIAGSTIGSDHFTCGALGPVAVTSSTVSLSRLNDADTAVGPGRGSYATYTPVAFRDLCPGNSVVTGFAGHLVDLAPGQYLQTGQVQCGNPTWVRIVQDNCSPANACQNGATCVDGVGIYSCSCPAPFADGSYYTGQLCDTLINPPSSEESGVSPLVLMALLAGGGLIASACVYGIWSCCFVKIDIDRRKFRSGKRRKRGEYDDDDTCSEMSDTSSVYSSSDASSCSSSGSSESSDDTGSEMSYTSSVYNSSDASSSYSSSGSSESSASSASGSSHCSSSQY